MPQTGTSLARLSPVDVRRRQLGSRLGSSVLVLVALACGWPQLAEAAGKRTFRNRAAVVGRPQRTQLFAPRRPLRPGAVLTATLRRRALEAEPPVTAALRNTLEGTGATLVDLDRRIKPSRSLLRKIRRDQRGGDLTLEQAGSAIADVLRYKLVLPFAHYESTRRQVVRRLEGRGFAVVKSKDNWGTRYPGHNLQLKTPAGYRFEIQFQTPASYEANRRTHELYRRLRESDGEEAAALERRILEITGTVPIPRGVGPQLPGMTRSNEVMTPR